MLALFHTRKRRCLSTLGRALLITYVSALPALQTTISLPTKNPNYLSSNHSENLAIKKLLSSSKSPSFPKLFFNQTKPSHIVADSFNTEEQPRPKDSVNLKLKRVEIDSFRKVSLPSLFSNATTKSTVVEKKKKATDKAELKKARVKKHHYYPHATELTQGPASNLFEKAFGAKKKPESHQFLAPILINKEKKQRVLTRVKQGKVSFQASSFSRWIQPLVQPKVNQEVLAIMGEDGFIALDKLREIGFEAFFDESKLYLSINVPAELRRHQTLALRKRHSLEGLDYLEPSDLSAYLNYYASGSYNKSHIASKWDPFRTRCESAVNFNQWVLENNFIYSNDPKSTRWQHSFKRLSYDIEDSMARMSFGDFNESTPNYRNVSGYGGVGISRLFSLNPSYDKAPGSRQEFFLENTEGVTIGYTLRFDGASSTPSTATLSTASANGDALMTTGATTTFSDNTLSNADLVLQNAATSDFVVEDEDFTDNITLTITAN